MLNTTRLLNIAVEKRNVLPGENFPVLKGGNFLLW